MVGDMMDYLYNLDLNDSEILDMVKLNDHIAQMSSEEVITYIYILVDVGCTQKQIHDIITANPFYFSRDDIDVRKFLRRLMAFDDIDVPEVLEGNPWLLNKDAFEIDDYLEENRDKGLSDKEILENFIFNCI